jgi:hypothetical protein
VTTDVFISAPLSPAHEDLLYRRSAITPAVAAHWVEERDDGLSFRWCSPFGEQVHQFRPDHPGVGDDGKPVKYLWPKGRPLILNALRRADGPVALLVEGTKQSLAALSWAPADVSVFGMVGCWGWRANGGPSADLDALQGKEVVVILDADRTSNAKVQGAAAALDVALSGVAKSVRFADLAGASGTDGLDDVLARLPDDQRTGYVADLVRAASPSGSTLSTEQDSPDADVPAPHPTGLAAVHATFIRWLGKGYDLDALDAVLAVAAAERLRGDPAWLLMVSGSGNAKTETVVALAGIGAHVTSTITSEGALLSATSRKERASDATGGLLRKIGDRGVLVVKDFTSILSMNRDTRAAVLAALREVYDGRWERNVGTDGGRTLTWTGRLVLIGAVTTAYDSAHAVIAAMGDRFALVRVDSATGRMDAGRQALGNVGHERQMRDELAAAVRDLVDNMEADRATLSETDHEVLLSAANLVTQARTAVERDYQGNVINAHAPEMPTRFAKMLGQVVRGGLAIGMTREHAHAVALRMAADSMPPLRLDILADVADYPGSRTGDVQGRLQRPRSTVDRELQALHILGLLVQVSTNKEAWRYSLSSNVDREALAALVTRNVSTPGMRVEEDNPEVSLGSSEVSLGSPEAYLGTDKSGDAALVCTTCGHPLDPIHAAAGSHPGCDP